MQPYYECGRITIYNADCRDVLPILAPGSVDLVLTDPPYPKEYLPLYDALGVESERLLIQGGYVFAYAGTEHLPSVLNRMSVPGLNYFWTDTILHNGGYPRLWHKRLLSGFKPVVIFTKGPPAVLRWRSTVHSVAMDKRFHEWGQGSGFAVKIIEMLTNPDAVILDPFLGGGTTAWACRVTGRRCIGIEINEDYCRIAVERLQQEVLPFDDAPTEKAEQLALP